jgi:hypothetical protein
VDAALDRLRDTYDAHAKERTFQVGDYVFVRQHVGQKKLRPGIVAAIVGPLTYDVQVGSKMFRLHIDDLRPNLTPHKWDLAEEDEQRALERRLDPIVQPPHQQAQDAPAPSVVPVPSAMPPAQVAPAPIAIFAQPASLPAVFPAPTSAPRAVASPEKAAAPVVVNQKPADLNPVNIRSSSRPGKGTDSRLKFEVEFAGKGSTTSMPNKSGVT